jgi:hypothetical protein
MLRACASQAVVFLKYFGDDSEFRLSCPEPYHK